ncbi:uncharacterized protein LOC129759478 [Uranotaenia lowii]|uniref:uncharacterized protein LOC129759478 n=1 Tax=Uranotaenia lowii TaxID=190385 RepID=UPI0024787B16|nr:uncharacterized protein LOC129759478 [Uranotaenia lowii]
MPKSHVLIRAEAKLHEKIIGKGVEFRPLSFLPPQSWEKLPFLEQNLFGNNIANLVWQNLRHSSRYHQSFHPPITIHLASPAAKHPHRNKLHSYEGRILRLRLTLPGGRSSEVSSLAGSDCNSGRFHFAIPVARFQWSNHLLRSCYSSGNKIPENSNRVRFPRGCASSGSTSVLKGPRQHPVGSGAVIRGSRRSRDAGSSHRRRRKPRVLRVGFGFSNYHRRRRKPRVLRVGFGSAITAGGENRGNCEQVSGKQPPQEAKAACTACRFRFSNHRRRRKPRVLRASVSVSNHRRRRKPRVLRAIKGISNHRRRREPRVLRAGFSVGDNRRRRKPRGLRPETGGQDDCRKRKAHVLRLATIVSIRENVGRRDRVVPSVQQPELQHYSCNSTKGSNCIGGKNQLPYASGGSSGWMLRCLDALVSASNPSATSKG